MSRNGGFQQQCLLLAAGYLSPFEGTHEFCAVTCSNEKFGLSRLWFWIDE